MPAGKEGVRELLKQLPKSFVPGDFGGPLFTASLNHDYHEFNLQGQKLELENHSIDGLLWHRIRKSDCVVLSKLLELIQFPTLSN